jgi:predicted small integral membrane protein
MATASAVKRQRTFDLDVVTAAVAVVGSGFIVPGLGLLLAVILSCTIFKRRRAAQIILLALGVLITAFSLSSILLGGQTTTWVGPPVLVQQ